MLFFRTFEFTYTILIVSVLLGLLLLLLCMVFCKLRILFWYTMHTVLKSNTFVWNRRKWICLFFYSRCNIHTKMNRNGDGWRVKRLQWQAFMVKWERNIDTFICMLVCAIFLFSCWLQLKNSVWMPRWRFWIVYVANEYYFYVCMQFFLLLSSILYWI